MGGFFGGGGGASVDLASPSAIGNTTPNTGAFTTLSFAPANNTTGFSNTGNSLTGSNAQSLVSLAQTWNTTGTPTLINVAVTNTASNAASKFIDCKVGSDSKFHVTRTGKIWTPAGLVGSNGGVGTDGLALEAVFSNYGIGFNADGSIISVLNNKQIALLGFQCIVNNVAYFGFSASEEVNTNATKDVRLFRDAAAVLAQRNTTNAQTFRLYNTFTSATNFERLNFRWASNEFILDAEAGSGGGTLRGIKIGSATSSLLGFYGVTPVDQPATVTDPTGGGTQDAEARTAINAIIDRLQELGLIA